MKSQRMQSQITISDAKEADLLWINQQYKTIGFKPSCLENELIAVAKTSAVTVGVGRLQYIVDDIAELGGMYVDSAFRQQGIAEKLVAYLLANSNIYKTIYCLPFAHLATFYQSFDFRPVAIGAMVPKQVSAKLEWCNDTYEQLVLLHALTNPCIT
jgi:N-acetylglutamate synthase-like GNAT family acetyltransferase